MRIPVILAVSLAAVLASSFLIVGPFSMEGLISTKSNEAEAQALPLIVRDRFTAKQLAGDAETNSGSLKINEEFVDPENHCEFCTRVEYLPGTQGRAGFSYQDLSGLDLSGSKKVRLWMMGEDGTEKIKFKLAGKKIEKIQDKVQDRLGKLADKLAKNIFKNEKFALTTEEVTLERNWKKYEVDLTGVDLKGITNPFALELAGNGQKQVVYLKGLVYDDEQAEDPLTATAEETVEPLVAEIIANGTEGVAPATFEFEANITGGSEPYSMTWDFGDTAGEGQTVVNTFDIAEEYNVTMTVTDASDQSASDSIIVTITPPLAIEEPAGNATSDLINDTSITNATDLQDEASQLVEEEIIEEPVEIEAYAGIDIVAQPGETVTLLGRITGVDAETEGLDLLWEQASGPTAEVGGAESFSPTINIPDLEDDAEMEFEFAANLESTGDSDSVTIFVQLADEVDGAQEESLVLEEGVATEWEDECDDIAECMSDDDSGTFAVATPENIDSVNLFSFEEFSVENAEIHYVKAVATASADETGFLLFIGADAANPDEQTDPLGAASVDSSSPSEYMYVWEENPVTNDSWTVESLNSFLAGYAYGDGDSDIRVSEFSLLVNYSVEEPEPETLEIPEILPELAGDETPESNGE